jgi:hypothetical protein
LPVIFASYVPIRAAQIAGKVGTGNLRLAAISTNTHAQKTNPHRGLFFVQMHKRSPES